jgi:hypothetical protein
MNSITRVALIGVILILVVAAVVYNVQSSSGASTYDMIQPSAGSSSSESSIMVAPNQTQISQQLRVSTIVRDSQGQPLVNVPVEFDVAVNFFGQQQVKIGTAQTDGRGMATITYQPTWDGTYDITAHFMGDANHPPVQGTRTITYSGPVPQYHPETVGLLPIRQWITPVVFAGVGLFWLILIFIGVRTLRGIFQAGNQFPGKYN